MPSQKPKVPITDWLINTALFEVYVEKGFYVNTYNYFLTLSFLYEAGAILGHAMKDKLNILSEMFSDKSSNEFWGEMAQERLYMFKKRFKKEPDTFQEFIFERKLQLATGLHPYDAWQLAACKSPKVLDIYDRKIPLIVSENGVLTPRKKETQGEIRWMVQEGIGFGSHFIKLTERMNNYFWESVQLHIDRFSKEYSERYGNPGIPGFVMSFKEQEKEILTAVAFCAKIHYSELISPLGLESYLKADAEKLLSAMRSWFKLVIAINDIDTFWRLPY